MPDAPDTNRPPSTDWRQSVREAGPYVGLGLQMALSMAFFVGLGYAGDWWLGTLPWLTIAGGVLGMAALFALLLRVSREMQETSERKFREKEERRGGNPDAERPRPPSG